MHKVVPVFALVLALGACAVGPRYTPPEIDAPDAYDRAEPDLNVPEEPVARFWEQFQDPLLDRLVADAIAANHDLRIAVARLEEARALARVARRDLYPTVTSGASYTDSRTSAAQIPGGSSDSFDSEVYDVGFDAFWELDLFGRVRRSNEARRAELEAAAGDLVAAQVSIASEVVRSYFELRGFQEQLAVARRNAENQSSSLELTQARLDAGSGTEFDTSRAAAQLHTTLARIPGLQTAVVATIHRIGVLTGREPQVLRADLEPDVPIPALPDRIAVGSPEALLRRRPDINAAERRLAAATARVGVAVADLFPKITLGHGFGWSATEFDDLGDDGSERWSLGPLITWPAFDFGRVRAQVGVADAQLDATLAGYEQTVLRALEETETALARYANQRREVAELRAAAAASGNAARLARLRFEGGVADFLQVLDAERTQLEAEDRLASSRTAAATALIALHKALGVPFATPDTSLRRTAAER
jgi:outer membrane protein, multidrug efflux system